MRVGIPRITWSRLGKRWPVAAAVRGATGAVLAARFAAGWALGPASAIPATTTAADRSPKAVRRTIATEYRPRRRSAQVGIGTARWT